MAAIDDVWEHAQHVRMWLATAHQPLSATTSKTPGRLLARLLSRGGTSQASLEEAADAIGKMKLAFLDLERSLHRAGMSPVQLATPGIEVGGKATSAVVENIARATKADLATVDSLAEEIERLQKQARSPELR